MRLNWAYIDRGLSQISSDVVYRKQMTAPALMTHDLSIEHGRLDGRYRSTETLAVE
jgi:hypothetical protein